MSRTSKALKRLGVAGIVVATIGAGVPALVGAAAQAATPGPTTHLSITPGTQQGAAGTCLLFTVTPFDANNGTPSDTNSQQIQLEATPTGASTQQVQFCNPTPPFAANGSASQPANAFFGTPAQPAFSSTTAAAAPANTTGAQTFGLRSYAPGGANIRAYIDSNSNGQFDAGEPQGTATATFTAGGNNTSDTNSGGNAAQDAVKTITEVPQSSSQDPVAAGNGASSTQFVTVQLKNASGDPVSGVTVSATFGSGSANGAQTSPAASAQNITCVGGGTKTANGTTTLDPGPGTATTGSQGGSVSNNTGTATCYYTAARAGTDTVIVYVNQTSGGTSGPDSGEPQLTVTRTTLGAPNTNTAAARNIDLKPEGPIDTTTGTSRTFTATVTDSAGKPVQGVSVQFSKSGAGTFNATSQTPTGVTNAQGQTSVAITSAQGETGQAVVTSTITTGGTECGNAAGSPAGTSAGNCSDSEVTNFVAASPSASPSATPTASQSPTSTPCTATQQNLPVRVNTPTINATGLASVTITGAPAGATIEVQGYSQNHYGTANFNNDPTPIDRVVTADSNGAATISDLRPASNTRLRARVRGCQFGANALGSVINVRAQETLQVTRVGTRRYTISGKSIPARPGGLIINIYCDKCSPQLIAQPRADATSGQYSYTVTFPASLANQRVNLQARTGQDAQNAPGASNIRNLLVY